MNIFNESFISCFADADFTFKQEIENVIKENGEYWLPKASKTGLFLDMEPLQSSSSLFKLRGGGCFKDTPESSFVSEVFIYYRIKFHIRYQIF